MAGSKVKIGIIGGTGLDDPDILEERKEEYVETVFGKPSDALIHGKIKGVQCVLLARHGRKHDRSPSNINYRANIWALKEAGCTHIIASTACGSLKEEIVPGDFVVLDSFIDRTLRRDTTFFDQKTVGGPEGVCHVPMEPAYDPGTRELLIQAARELGVRYHPSGTSVCIEGPRFSTRAESNVYRGYGAATVNMTTAPEAQLAKEAGLLYASIAMATDYDCWRDVGEKVTVEHVLRTFKNNVGKMQDIFKTVVPLIAKKDWTEEIKAAKKLIEVSFM